MAHDPDNSTRRQPPRHRGGSGARPLTLLLGVLLAASTLPALAQGQARDPKSEAARYFGMGNAAFDRGEYEQAERMFRVCIALAPDLAGPYRRLGQALRRVGRCEEALDHFLSYLRLRPEGRYSDSIREEMTVCSRDASTRPGGAAAAAVASASLQVQVNVAGALVRVDGLEMGRSPLAPLTLKAGGHRVEASHPEYFDAQQTIDLAGGAEQTLRLKLTPRPSEPSRPAPQALVPVELGISPAGAKVHVDGKLVGLSPLQAFTLAPGTHTVLVVKPGFLQDERPLVVRAGEPVTLELRLVRLGGAPVGGGELSPWASAPDAPRPPTPPPAGPPVGSGAPPERAAPRWVLLGGGGASAACLVAGVVLGSLAWSKAGDYDTQGAGGDRRDIKESGEALALGADVLLGTGVLLGAATVGALLLWPQPAAMAPAPAAAADGPQAASAGPRIRWAPSLAPGSVGMQGALTW